MTNTIKLLFVDDEVEICRYVETALRPFGIHVVVAHDGLKAQETFAADHFDLVLTDVRMPRCTGFQLLQAIKNMDPSMPVLICSSYTNDFRIVSDAHSSKADGMITKPFDLDELVELIRSSIRDTVVKGAA